MFHDDICILLKYWNHSNFPSHKSHDYQYTMNSPKISKLEYFDHKPKTSTRTLQPILQRKKTAKQSNIPNENLQHSHPRNSHIDSSKTYTRQTKKPNKENSCSHKNESDRQTNSMKIERTIKNDNSPSPLAGGDGPWTP